MRGGKRRDLLLEDDKCEKLALNFPRRRVEVQGVATFCGRMLCQVLGSLGPARRDAHLLQIGWAQLLGRG